MKITLFLKFVLLALLLSPGFSEFVSAREWLDNTGQHKTNAELYTVRMSEKVVVLFKKDGKLVKVPLTRLSTNDKNFIDDFVRKDGNQSDVDRINPDFINSMFKDPSDKKITPEMFKNIEAKSNEGDPDGQFLAALCYIDGKGTSQDHNKALDLLKKAGAQGHLLAEATAKLLEKDIKSDKSRFQYRSSRGKVRLGITLALIIIGAIGGLIKKVSGSE